MNRFDRYAEYRDPDGIIALCVDGAPEVNEAILRTVILVNEKRDPPIHLSFESVIGHLDEACEKEMNNGCSPAVGAEIRETYRWARETLESILADREKEFAEARK